MKNIYVLFMLAVITCTSAFAVDSELLEKAAKLSSNPEAMVVKAKELDLGKDIQLDKNSGLISAADCNRIVPPSELIKLSYDVLMLKHIFLQDAFPNDIEAEKLASNPAVLIQALQTLGMQAIQNTGGITITGYRFTPAMYFGLAILLLTEEEHHKHQLPRERQAALERRYAQIVNDGVFLRLSGIDQKEINGVLTRLRGLEFSDPQLTAQEGDLRVHEQYITQQVAREQRQAALSERYAAIANDGDRVFLRLSDDYQREINGVLARLRGPQLSVQALIAQETDFKEHVKYIPQQLAKEQLARERQAALSERYAAIANDGDRVFLRLSDDYQREINGVLARLRGPQLSVQALTAQETDFKEHVEYIPQQLAKEQLARERQDALVGRYAAIVSNGGFNTLPEIYQGEINGVLARLRGPQLSDQALTAQEGDLVVHDKYIP